MTDISEKYPFLTKSQIWAISEGELFGFDRREFPVLRQGMVAVNRNGHKVIPMPPVVRARVEDASIKLVAVVQVEFNVEAEGVTNEQLLTRLRDDPDLRNRIARKTEAILRFADSFVDKHVGWYDDNHPIELSESLQDVRVKGLGKP